MKKKTTKRKHNDDIRRKFSLSMSKNEARNLWTTGCKSYLCYDAHRFVTTDDSDIKIFITREFNKVYYMYGCDSFLDAKILSIWLGKDAAVLYDEWTGKYSVHTSKPWRPDWFSTLTQAPPNRSTQKPRPIE